jgi:acyl-[acyl-carrier-protein]-phospholipid O-acyltransferase/long-chain-fatty-acid--[acyl-carrier-protein] ligase
MLDPFFIVAAIPRMLRFVVTKGVFDFKPLKWILTKLNMVPIAEKLDKVKLEEFNELCRKEVNQGHILCIFPEGQISRIGHLLEFKKGIEHIAKGVDVPIIPVRMSGVKGTPLSFDIGSSQPIMPWFKGFRNKISVQIGEPLPPESSANLLRQKVQLLNAYTFEKRLKDYHTLQYFMKKTARRLKSRDFQFGQLQSSFQSFYEEAQLRAGFWGQTNNQYVGIDVGNHAQMGLIHASCLYADKTPVFLQPEMDEEMKTSIIGKYKLDLILSDSKKDDIHIHPEVFFATENKRAAKAHSSDIVGIFWEKDHNSGWISLAMTHANFLASIRGFMHLFNKPTDARVYSDYPAYTTYGNLANIWLPYFFGMSIYRSEEGENISAQISTGNINTLLTNIQTVVTLNETLPDSDWQKLDYVLTGNETLPVSIKTSLQKQDVFVSESMAIAGGGVTVAMNTPDYEVVGIGGGKPMLQEGSQKDSIGRPLPGMGIRILNEQGADLTSGEVGNLFVYGAGICGDYKDNEGWLDAKTRASVDEKGFLYIE